MPEPSRQQNSDRKSVGSTGFDVFLCHHSSDKQAVRAIGQRLKGHGLRVWLDEWELQPGRSWQVELEKQIERIGAAAVFVGQEGLGPWQELEIRGFLGQFVKRECPVIPVLLKNCPESPPELPVFLTDLTWVDFREKQPDPFEQLIWGITGEKPGRPVIPQVFDAEDDEDAVLEEWFDQVSEENRRLGDHFERPVELRDLEAAWVRLDLAFPQDSEDLSHRTLDHFLDLDPEEHSWVTNRWLVEGDPGSGKTTLLRHLAGGLATAADRTRIPLFIPLPKIVEPILMPLDYVAEEYSAFCGPRLTGVLDQAGRQGRIVVLLDSLDEVPPERRDRVVRLLARLGKDWPTCSVVITSRPFGLGEPPPGFQKLLLQPLDDDQRQRFLEKWFRHRETPDQIAEARRASAHFDSERGLSELSHNPLHLTLLTVLWEQGVKAPTRRSELYDEIFELLLEGRHRNKPVAIPAAVFVRKALRYLAFKLTCEDLPAEDPEKLVGRLWDSEIDDVRDRLVKIWGQQLRGFLDAVHERTYVLGPHDGPRVAWRFWHRTFREALTAEWLEETFGDDREALLKQIGPLLQQGDEGRWAEPLALLAGHFENPDALVRSVVEVNRPLGLRALATAQGVSAEVLVEILALSGGWEDRQKVFESIPQQLGEPEACLALVDQLSRNTRDGNDLFFLYEVTEEVAAHWPACARQAQQLEDRFFDHIPVPEDPELFRSVDTPFDGRMELWCEIPTGEGWVGSPESEEGRIDWEGPRHRVTIERSFQMAAVPVTNTQYAAFDPDRADADRLDHPVVRVTWYEAVSFCRWLAARVPGCYGARLPVEEEWEYACRAGTETRYWSGDSEEALAEVGWYGKNSGGHTHCVGEKRANPWGLYDVHGNVREWTASRRKDFSGREAGITIDSAAQTADLAAVSRRVGRVFRGGGFLVSASRTRAAFRSWGQLGVAGRLRGFRVVRLPPPGRLSSKAPQ